MDLALYSRVLWRFRFLVAAGFLLAVALAVLSVAKVSFSGSPTLTYRKAETWQSQTQLLVTQQGFPWGRTVLPPSATPSSGTSPGTTYADPTRLADLATLYAQFANSDPVKSRLHLLPTQSVTAEPAVDRSTSYQSTLPIVAIFGTDTTPTAAAALAERAATVFKLFIGEQQQAAAIPVRDRVVLQTMVRAARPQLVEGRKMTLPVIAFLAVMIATIGSAFLLENIRPLAAMPHREDEPAGTLSPVRRSA